MIGRGPGGFPLDLVAYNLFLGMKLGKLALGVHRGVPSEQGAFPNNWETGLELAPPLSAQTQALRRTTSPK